MIIQFASDLHLGSWPNWLYLVEKQPILGPADLLILAGDIDRIDDIGRSAKQIVRHFKEVYVVPGEVEYKSANENILRCFHSLEKRIVENLTLVNNKTIIYDSVRIIFTTLWTEITESTPEVEEYFKKRFYIWHRGEHIDLKTYDSNHQTCKKFLITELAKPFAGQTIVVSHYPPFPSMFSRNPRHQKLPEAYYVDLLEIIHNFPIDHWIYGHNGRNEPSFRIGTTWFHTNQLGDLMYGEQTGFDPQKVISF